MGNYVKVLADKDNFGKQIHYISYVIVVSRFGALSAYLSAIFYKKKSCRVICELAVNSAIQHLKKPTGPLPTSPTEHCSSIPWIAVLQ